MSLERFEQQYIAQEIYPALECTITQELMRRPAYYLVNRIKQVFEHDAIIEWIDKIGTCPNTRIKINKSMLLDDEETSALITQLTIQNGSQREFIPIETLSESIREMIMLRQFFLAIRTNNLVELKKFSDHLAHYVNKTDVDGWSALHFAAIQGNEGMIRLLIAAGALLDANTPGKMTPLFIAVQNKHARAVALLLKAGANINAHPSILYSSVERSSAVTRLLLQAGADATVICDEYSPLHAAVKQHGNNENVELLLKYGAKIDARTSAGDTPLHLAVHVKNNEKIVQILLDAGANVKLVNLAGQTAIQRGEDGTAPYQASYQPALDLIKAEAKLSEGERQKILAQKAHLKRLRLANDSITLEEFRAAYLAKYNAVRFFKIGTMKDKLENGEIASIQQVRTYAADKEGSRTQIVYDELLRQKYALMS